MKHRNILLALAGFIAGIGASMVLPALAQQRSESDTWEMMVTSYSGSTYSYIGVVKHNVTTGQTLVLTCQGECEEKKNAWLDLPVKSAK